MAGQLAKDLLFGALQISGYQDSGVAVMVVLAVLVILVWTAGIPLTERAPESVRTWLRPHAVGSVLTVVILVGGNSFLPRKEPKHPVETKSPMPANTIQIKPTPPPVLRPPNLKAYFGETAADNATFVVTVGKEGTFTLPALEIKNSGGSDAPSPRLRLFLSEAIENSPGFDWQPVKNTEKGFRSQFYYGGPFIPPIGGGETWVGPRFGGKIVASPVPSDISARGPGVTRTPGTQSRKSLPVC